MIEFTPPMWSPLHHFCFVSLAHLHKLKVLIFFPLFVLWCFEMLCSVINLKSQDFSPVWQCPTVSLFLSKQLQIYETDEQCAAVKAYLFFFFT